MTEVTSVSPPYHKKTEQILLTALIELIRLYKDSCRINIESVCALLYQSRWCDDKYRDWEFRKRTLPRSTGDPEPIAPLDMLFLEAGKIDSNSKAPALYNLYKKASGHLENTIYISLLGRLQDLVKCPTAP